MRQPRRLKKPPGELFSFGDMLRLLREARGFSKEHVSREMRCNIRKVDQLENGYIRDIHGRHIVDYLDVVGGCLIAVGVTVPAGVDTRTQTVTIAVDKHTTALTNLIRTDNEKHHEDIF